MGGIALPKLRAGERHPLWVFWQHCRAVWGHILRLASRSRRLPQPADVGAEDGIVPCTCDAWDAEVWDVQG